MFMAQSGERRYILGGGRNEAIYMFVDEDAQSPFDRLTTYGFRCMKNPGPGIVPESLTHPVQSLTRDCVRLRFLRAGLHIGRMFAAGRLYGVFDHIQAEITRNIFRRLRASHSSGVSLIRLESPPDPRG